LERFYIYFENEEDLNKIKNIKYKENSKLMWLSINEDRFINSFFILNYVLKNCNSYYDSSRTMRISFLNKTFNQFYKPKKNDMIYFLRGNK
jgi:hypothetical protein